MIRIMIATEGKTDETVCEEILRDNFVECDIQRKRFTSRSFQTVLKATPQIIKAAHYGLFDIVVIHFDLDSTLRNGDLRNLSASDRWVAFWDKAKAEIARLNEVPARRERLKYVLMTPHESVEAWLAWGAAGGNGTSFELMARKTLKTGLYGDTPFPTDQQISELTQSLIQRLSRDRQWPLTLRRFIHDLRETVQ